MGYVSPAYKAMFSLQTTESEIHRWMIAHHQMFLSECRGIKAPCVSRIEGRIAILMRSENRPLVRPEQKRRNP